MPAGTSPPSRTLEAADVPSAAALVAAAYVDDPLCAYMLPIRATRPRTLLKFFRAYCGAAAASSTMLGAGEPLAGVAIWSRPGGDSVAIGPRTLGAFLPLLATLYPLGLLRARPIIQLQGALRRRHAPVRHYYLDNVAVHPDRRGKGIASALIRPVLAQADREGWATYTDTFTAANVPLYEHFGFRCLQQQRDPRTGLSVWSLLRPRSS